MNNLLSYVPPFLQIFWFERHTLLPIEIHQIIKFISKNYSLLNTWLQVVPVYGDGHVQYAILLTAEHLNVLLIK
jgi:hypothetical protein